MTEPTKLKIINISLVVCPDGNTPTQVDYCRDCAYYRLCTIDHVNCTYNKEPEPKEEPNP